MKQPNPKKCRACKVKFQPRNSMQVACSPRCALLLAKEKQAKKERAEIKAAKDKLKTKSEWLKEAQAAFNAYIRIRDKGKPCISCGSIMEFSSYGGKVDAGHYRSVGAAPHLRFHPLNCHAQCVKCNRYLSSNTVEYRIGLINRIGVDFVEKIESMNGSSKLSVEKICKIKSIYKRKLKLYKRLFRNEKDESKKG